MNKKIIIIITLVVILLLGGGYYFIKKTLRSGPAPVPPRGYFRYDYTNKYSCDDNKKVVVNFWNQQGGVRDPNNAKLYLENATSGFALAKSTSSPNLYDGASNNFQIKVNGSRRSEQIEIMENGTTTYSNCESLESKNN